MPKVPVKIVEWDEIVDWAWGLAKKILDSGWRPDVIVAVARGGYVPARLLADLLDVTDMLSVQSQHWTEAAKAAERAILKYPYTVDLEGRRVLVVDDIVDTGETLVLAKRHIEENWNAGEVRTATLQWISSVAKYRPDYYYIEVTDWTWFQYPWTRLEDLVSFVKRILTEDERLKGVKDPAKSLVEDVFRDWYGVDPHDFGRYWDEVLARVGIQG